jgi:hypothetical protein
MKVEAQETQSRLEYDVPTAVTFLLAGLGIGSIFGILYAATRDSQNNGESQRTQPTLQ